MEKIKLIKILENFNSKTIAVIGDMMIDEYIIGKVERISPEAPVPILQVNKNFHLFHLQTPFVQFRLRHYFQLSRNHKYFFPLLYSTPFFNLFYPNMFVILSLPRLYQ